MGNVVAIAQKELKSYFASPIGYIITGIRALLYGWFFFNILYFFVRQSMSMNQFQQGPQALNLNQQLIRPLIAQNLPILVLFLLPAVTMRTYAEEKRSGTVELLLTSPLTDLEIILGKFFGAMSLYAVMLGVTLLHVLVLFAFGRPEWKPILTAYIGLLLLGGCFISVGLFISSLTRNQIVAFVATFGVFLMLWVITWIGSFLGPTGDQLTQYLSIIDHFDDFGKGVLDTSHLIYYTSFIAFGLFLTAKSLDAEHWRG
jgi:ABC-2 type transport system permease protein